VVQIVPNKTSQALSDITTYLEIVPRQFDYVIDQYRVVDKRLTNDVNGKYVSHYFV